MSTFIKDRGVVTRLGEMPFVYDDGGRDAAGFKGRTGDCVARAIAIAMGLPYLTVYDELNAFAKLERPRNGRKRSGARTGVRKQTTRSFIESKGWRWTPTMAIGSGCKVHLAIGELPGGRLIVSVSKHVVAVIDGEVRDTYNPSRGGSRCVYGYWMAP